VLVFLFFKKRRTFPRLMIILIAVLVAGAFFDLVVMNAIARKYPDIADPSLVKDLTRCITRAMVWIPYFLVSKRVRTTFTR
jgi:hypothetical protein